MPLPNILEPRIHLQNGPASFPVGGASQEEPYFPCVSGSLPAIHSPNLPHPPQFSPHHDSHSVAPSIGIHCPWCHLILLPGKHALCSPLSSLGRFPQAFPWLLLSWLTTWPLLLLWAWSQLPLLVTFSLCDLAFPQNFIYNVLISSPEYLYPSTSVLPPKRELRAHLLLG